MKVLLVAVNAKYIHSNLAIYSLKAYAKGEAEKWPKDGMTDWSVELAEYTINQQKDDILIDIYRHRPDVACFSCYIWNLDYIEELVGELAKIRPDMQIWLGGPEVSYDSVDVLGRLPQAKGVMKGEGEETFACLLRNWQDGEGDAGLIKTEGITFRKEDGEIVENPWRQVMDLSKVPFVYRDMKAFEHKIVYYESSRGCPFSCSYCLSSVDKRLRFRDTSLVEKELQFFIDQQVPQVKFVDRTFNCRHEHAVHIWKYIAEHDRGITNFHFEISADLLNEEELQILENMRPGLIQLEIGVQSTNPETIRAIRRTMDFEKVRCIVGRIQKQGNIHQHLDLIAGLPYEDIDSFSRSFDDVYSLKPEQLQLGFLKVLKGSYMEEQKEAYGLRHKGRPPYEVLCTRWLSYEDVICLKGIEEMVEVYYNSRQFTHTLDALEELYDSAFGMYDGLRKFYEEKELGSIQHKRSARYAILLEYIVKNHPEREDYYKDLLTYDYYLRENAKTRPEFAGEHQMPKEMLRNFYEREERNRQYLPSYGAYDKNQMRKMTHMEYFSSTGKYILFDYKERNPLNQEARTCMIEPEFLKIDEETR